MALMAPTMIVLYFHFMTELEKRDILIEQLAMLYTIQADLKEESRVLNHNIVITEQRLIALGYSDFSRLKP